MAGTCRIKFSRDMLRLAMPAAGRALYKHAYYIVSARIFAYDGLLTSLGRRAARRRPRVEAWFHATRDLASEMVGATTRRRHECQKQTEMRHTARKFIKIKKAHNISHYHMQAITVHRHYDNSPPHSQGFGATISNGAITYC